MGLMGWLRKKNTDNHAEKCKIPKLASRSSTAELRISLLDRVQKVAIKLFHCYIPSIDLMTLWPKILKGFPLYDFFSPNLCLDWDLNHSDWYPPDSSG